MLAPFTLKSFLYAISLLGVSVFFLAPKVFEQKTEQTPAVPSIFIGDGSQIEGRDALQSLSKLIGEGVGDVEFLGPNEKRRSVRFLSTHFANQMPGCPFALMISKKGYFLSDEGLTIDELRDRLLTLSEVAKIGESTPFTLLAIEKGVPGTKLVKLLNAIHDTGVAWRIGTPAFETIVEKAAARPPSTPRPIGYP